MDERKSFSAEELALAKSVDLTAVAASLGYTVKKIGRYHTLKEMDSIRIYNAQTGSGGPGNMKRETTAAHR